MIEISSCIQRAGKHCEDAIAVFETGNFTVMCLADGAGGLSGGHEAASMACSMVSYAGTIGRFTSPDEFEEFLRNLDEQVVDHAMAGEASVVIVLINEQGVMGASVGDCGCWVCEEEFHYELTHLQLRKPLIGSGLAQPVGFGPVQMPKHLLLGSDGLFSHVSMSDILPKLGGSAGGISELAKDPAGKFHDDCSVIVCKST